DAWFVTGGAKEARVFHTSDRGRTWTVASTPAPAGNASSGLFSVAFLDVKRGFAAGGDYKQPQFAGLNGIRTEDGGTTWTPAPLSSTGFYSAVVPVPGAKDDLVAVGLAGESISHDAGRTWTKTGDTPMNAAAFTASDAGYAAGPKGSVLRTEARR
ncbi:MAG: WD40/YVTN/BNR-like repeat-containing protein, partial [Syntrophomonadaceae bacterium]